MEIFAAVVIATLLVLIAGGGAVVFFIKKKRVQVQERVSSNKKESRVQNEVILPSEVI